MQARIDRPTIRDRRHDWIRTNDLFRVNRFQDRNSLILGASAAPKSTRNHPKSTFSTNVSTIRAQKEEVAEEVVKMGSFA
jgi:hypothetical protein